MSGIYLYQVVHLAAGKPRNVEGHVAVLDAASRPDLVSELSPPSCGGHEVRSIGKGAVKSVVVTASGGRCVFFLSPISAQTLRKRAEGGLAKMR